MPGTPRSSSQRFTLEKGRLPKNPRDAESGEGWGDESTRCLERLMNAPFFWA